MALPQGLMRNVWQPSLQFVRYRKINIQKPRLPHFKRAVVLDLCKPWLTRYRKLDPNVPAFETCDKATGIKLAGKKRLDNPYETLLAKEMMDHFENSKLIAFFHSNNRSYDDDFDIRLLCKKNNMIFKLYSRYTVEKGVLGTQYEAIMSLYKSRTCVILSEEPNVGGLMKLLKKMQSIVLLAGIVDGKFMSRSELEAYSKLPDLQHARAGLVGLLNTAAQNVVHHMNHHQTTLVQSLKLYSDNNTSDTSS